MSAKWIRVTRAARCPICQHDSWCCIGEKWVNCMRVVSEKLCANGGYLHALGDAPQPVRHDPPPAPTIDAASMIHEWVSSTARAAYDRLAGLLGVSVESLLAIKCGWSDKFRAWGFPMVNGSGAIVGIRLRYENGRKISVAGGHEGVFLPTLPPQRTVFVPEGPTDLAALLTMGKFGIARPSCSGGIAALSATIARLLIERAVIVADNDPDKFTPNGKRWNPGLDGAQRLANDIGVPCCIVVLPVKDCREFANCGGTIELLDSLVSGLVWHQPEARAI